MAINYTKLKRALQKAEKLVKDDGIKSLPIDPIAVARKRGIVVQAKPETAVGVSGMLLRQGDGFGILYGTHIKSEGFQRFSIAHELGHFFLEGHIDHVFANGEIHESHAGFTSSDQYELEADHFAAGLLMPNPYFKKAINEFSDGFQAVEELSGICKTSLTATAIRYIECHEGAVAAVISSGNKIDCCFMSDTFKEIKDLTWLRKGVPLPVNTKTTSFNKDPNNIKAALREEADTNLSDWFGCSQAVSAKEEVIGLGSYGKTLTIITCNNLPSGDHGYGEDHWDYTDEEYEEMWTPRFKK